MTPEDAPAQAISRRRFLASASLATFAPLVLASCTARPRRIVGPSDRITLGFIGTGKQAHALMGACLPRGDVQVLAVCDVDTTRRTHAQSVVNAHYAAETSSGSYRGCAAYRDFRDLLARDDIDAVVIATPDHWHAFMTIAAAKAGKDIYCEKPLSHGIAEGRAMVAAVERKQRILQVGSMQRSSSEFRAASELVRNGVIGEVRRADFTLGGSAGGGPPFACELPGEPLEPGLDWDLWLGPAPKREYNSILSPRGVHNHYPAWRKYREYGGGGVCDWGAHHLDIIHWAMGLDATGPVEIFPAEQADASSGVRLRYANGFEARHLRATQSEENGVTFYGEEGRLFVGRQFFRLWIGEEQKAETQDDYTRLLKEYLPKDAVRLYRSTNHVSDWLSSIRTRKQPICTAEIGHRTATACHLTNLAYQHGKPLKWNPQTERFADGTGDSRWLAPELRRPWRIRYA
jgi:predicted dehydrogenase